MINKKIRQNLDEELKLENLQEIKKKYNFSYLFEAIIFILEKYNLIDEIEYIELNKIINKKVKSILEKEFKSLYLLKK